jgi:nicotinate-nucleotide adenylyltransferase
MRLGLFGGSFDPIHYGHLILAETCRETLCLDEVWLVPASTPPHKQTQDRAAAKHRLQMIELALAGHEQIRASSVEIDRGGVSYTVDTLAQVHALHPQATLFLLMGADSLRDLPTWREPARICELAIPAVVRRGGSPEPDFGVLASLVSAERLAMIRSAQVEMPAIELSSTDLRERVRTGKSLRFRTPRAVEKYIETQGLYRSLAKE